VRCVVTWCFLHIAFEERNSFVCKGERNAIIILKILGTFIQTVVTRAAMYPHLCALLCAVEPSSFLSFLGRHICAGMSRLSVLSTT
jgi:hypothetical protein